MITKLFQNYIALSRLANMGELSKAKQTFSYMVGIILTLALFACSVHFVYIKLEILTVVL